MYLSISFIRTQGVFFSIYAKTYSTLSPFDSPHRYIKNMNDKLDYIAIDFETANNYKNSACSVGLVRFIDGKETDACSSLIHPAKMYFNPTFTAEIHHISYDDVRDKPYFPEI